MINKNTNKKNNNNKKENIMTYDLLTIKEKNDFVEYFKSFYDEAKDKFITTDMIVDEAEFLINEDADGYYDWNGGDSNDRTTVYENIMEEHKENK